MNLEFLPNEILLYLFEYFNGINLLRAFYGLNSRFNFLLHNLFTLYSFKFNGVSKRKFDMICQRHLPFIINRIVNLNLSDYSETPGQINLFLSNAPSFNQFTQLRSLTLSHLHSHQTLLKLLDECHHLNNLMHLKIYSCSLPPNKMNFQLIVDNIWSLPNLTKCYLSTHIYRRHFLCVPTIISLSLECVTISYGQLDMNQINQLFQYTPRLTRFSTTVDSINDDYIPPQLPMLIDLKIRFSYSSDYSKMILFLQNISNLRHLDITISFNLIDGHQWEYTIQNYLPKLKTFRLKMYKRLPLDRNSQEQVDNLMNSFRNPFWINEHQWFIRCFTYSRFIHVQTVSESFDWSLNLSMTSWQSTYPHDDHLTFHNNVNKIDDDTFFDQPISSHIRLFNIKYLHIKFPLNDQFSSIVPSLNQLHSLTVSSYTDTNQSQLQTLLNRAPHLHELTVKQDPSLPLQMSLFTCTHISVRHLHLHDYNHCFNEEECITLSHSSLTIRCEVLSLRIKNRESIIHLVKKMTHLRVLHICCDDQNNLEQVQLPENDVKCCYKKTEILDELVQWLKDRLLSTCSVMNGSHYNHNISIWI
jgi:hypothetical protein